MNKKFKIINRLALLLFITGLILSFFTWVGLLIDLVAFAILIYFSRWTKISWIKILFYSIGWLVILGSLFIKYHTSKTKYLAMDWKLLPSAEKYYVDPLYQQRMMNYGFDSLMLSEQEMKNIKLFDSDTDVVPAPAPME